MDVVVTIPADVPDGRMKTKFREPWDSFWTLCRIPKKLRVGDHVWFVRNGVVVHALKVRRIIKNPRTPVRDAVGHNPPAPRGCRLWFESPSVDIRVPDYPDEILDEKGEFRVQVQGFQGFRYRWWILQEERAEEFA